MLAPSYFEKLYNKSYFEAGRRPRKRSLPSVNEHFENKPDAERALLYSFSVTFAQVNRIIYARAPKSLDAQKCVIKKNYVLF